MRNGIDGSVVLYRAVTPSDHGLRSPHQFNDLVRYRSRPASDEHQSARSADIADVRVLLRIRPDKDIAEKQWQFSVCAAVFQRPTTLYSGRLRVHSLRDRIASLRSHAFATWSSVAPRRISPRRHERDECWCGARCLPVRREMIRVKTGFERLPTSSGGLAGYLGTLRPAAHGRSYARFEVYIPTKTSSNKIFADPATFDGRYRCPAHTPTLRRSVRWRQP